MTVLCCIAGRGMAADSSSGDSASQPLQLTISSGAQVVGEEIFLSDIATVTDASDAFMEQIGAISLGRSPQPGKERSLSGRSIERALTAHVNLPFQAKVIIPEWISVHRAFQQLSESSLQKAFAHYVANRLHGIETDIRRFKVRGNDPLPVGKITLSPVENSKKPIMGAVTLQMAVCVDGKDMGRITLSGWVNRYEPVVCATRYVKRGEVLTERDIVLKKVNLAKAPSRLLRDPAKAIGKQVKSSLRAGHAVRYSVLEDPPVIEKGDRVKLLATSGGIQVTTVGIAMDEGREGDQIEVENMRSKKIVVGRVADRSTVEVMF